MDTAYLKSNKKKLGFGQPEEKSEEKEKED